MITIAHRTWIILTFTKKDRMAIFSMYFFYEQK